MSPVIILITTDVKNCKRNSIKHMHFMQHTLTVDQCSD